jgi:hypothetical protein
MDVNILDMDVNILDADVNILDADVNILDADVNILDVDVNILDVDVNILDADVNILVMDRTVRPIYYFPIIYKELLFASSKKGDVLPNFADAKVWVFKNLDKWDFNFKSHRLSQKI